MHPIFHPQLFPVYPLRHPGRNDPALESASVPDMPNSMVLQPSGEDRERETPFAPAIDSPADVVGPQSQCRLERSRPVSAELSPLDLDGYQIESHFHTHSVPFCGPIGLWPTGSSSSGGRNHRPFTAAGSSLFAVGKCLPTLFVFGSPFRNDAVEEVISDDTRGFPV